MAGTPNLDDAALLRPREVAAMFGVNSKTVSRWARAGKIPSVRTPGGHLRFSLADVRAAVARNELVALDVDP